jgi:uncharacterized protein
MLKWFMLVVYIILCGYVMWSFCRWTKKTDLPKRRAFNVIACVLIILFATSIFLGKFLPESSHQLLILRISNYWVGFLIYLIFFIVAADLLLLLLKLIAMAVKPLKEPLANCLKGALFHTILGAVVFALSISFTVYGCFHAKMLTTAHYEATIHKNAGNLTDRNLTNQNLTDLKMILIGDLHMGYSVGCSQIEDMVATINAENADIVVIAGDIFDNNYDALDDPERLEELLAQINSTYGTYAVFGNHDVEETLISGFPISSDKNAPRDPRMDTFLEKSNIHMLEDETVVIADSFYLTGRLDETRTGTNTARASLDELTANLDSSMPHFLLTHEPDHLSDYSAHGIDMLLCGHTHAGQFFPLTIVQPFVWENHWGMKMIDNMYSFVTSGVGVYGPDMRVGTNSEIMVIDVHFDKE